MKIYKSNFSAEELAQWDALIAKGKVAPEENQEEMEDEVPEFPPKKPAKKAEVEDPMEETKKSVSAELEAVQQELAEFKKSVEMEKFTALAKKYAPLGKKEDDLAKTLYNMKKSDETIYKSYVEALDEHLDLVNKSGLFAEIGKSAGGYSVASGAEAKADAKAREIMKSNPDIGYDAAIAKAWAENPELMAEYDAEYFGR